LREEKILIKRILTIGIIILFLSAFIIQSVAIYNSKNTAIPISSGKTLYVGGSGEGNYTKIQDAIDNTIEGDIIFVYDDSSPYYERLQISKSISIIGEDKNTTVIDGKNNGITIMINADFFTLSNFKIINNGLWAISLYESHNNKIRNIIILDNGITLVSSNNNTINSNRIISCYGPNLYIVDCDYNIINNNVFSDGYSGIQLDKSNNNRISYNSISNNIWGFKLWDSLCNIIEKNNILNNEYDFETFKIIDIRNFWKKNIWIGNYWNEPKFFPKVIFGLGFYKIPNFIGIPLPLIAIDWCPAKEPYYIDV
jgi:parallel beta-helix repeat protein